jgi:hypothetical protein
MRAADLPDDVVVVGPGMGAPSTGFEGFFALFVVLFVGAAIFSIVVGIRKYRILHEAGTDPFTADAAVAAKVLKSDMLNNPAQRSVEERLTELDGLLARGVISAEEHREARAAVLRG